MHSGLVAAFAFLTLGCIVVWIGLFSPYFITQEVTPIHEAHIGLYTQCDVNGDCSSLINAEPPLDPGWLKAAQGFGILGTMCVFIGWVLLLCWMCNKARNRWIKYVIIALIFVAVICYIVTLSLWEDNFNEIWPRSYEIWGFIIPWIGVILILIAGCIFLHPAVSNYAEQPASHRPQPWKNWIPARPSPKANEYDIPRPPIARVQPAGYSIQQSQAHSFQSAGYSSQQPQASGFQPAYYNSDRLSGISSVMVTQ